MIPKCPFVYFRVVKEKSLLTVMFIVMPFRLFSRSKREITADCNVYCYAVLFIFVYFRVVKEKSLLTAMFIAIILLL